MGSIPGDSPIGDGLGLDLPTSRLKTLKMAPAYKVLKNICITYTLEIIIIKSNANKLLILRICDMHCFVYFRSSRREYLHSVPFSCCDPSAAAPCFHRLVTVKRGEYRYPHHAFFRRGCTRVLLEILQDVLLATPLLILLPFLLEVKSSFLSLFIFYLI